MRAMSYLQADSRGYPERLLRCGDCTKREEDARKAEDARKPAKKADYVKKSIYWRSPC